jgi:hypothetical protein
LHVLGQEQHRDDREDAYRLAVIFVRDLNQLAHALAQCRRRILEPVHFAHLRFRRGCWLSM